MRITTKGHSAVTALVDIATRGGNTPVTLWGISERQKISVSYLEQLFGKLLRRNIVKSIRGPRGGYCLARPGAQITVADIINAVDEPLDVADGKRKVESQHGNPCSTDILWHRLDSMLHTYLSTISVQELVDRHLQERGDAALMIRSSLAGTRNTTTHPRVSL